MTNVLQSYFDFAVLVNALPEAHTITDQRAIETGDVVWKGLLGFGLICLLQALIDRWGRPHNPKSDSKNSKR